MTCHADLGILAITATKQPNSQLSLRTQGEILEDELKHILYCVTSKSLK